MRLYEFDNPYDDGAGQLGQDPNMVKVNAQQRGITDPDEEPWQKMSAGEKNQWRQRQKALESRIWNIYRNLRKFMKPEDLKAVATVTVEVPLEAVWGVGSSDLYHQNIVFDLGTYWDLSDHTIAYTIGHELGHLVWARGGKTPNYDPSSYVKPTNDVQRQRELDADTFGAVLAYRAGYDYSQAWQELKAEEKKPRDDSTRDHPSFEKRTAQQLQAIGQYKQSQYPGQGQPGTNPQTTALIKGTLAGIQKMSASGAAKFGSAAGSA